MMKTLSYEEIYASVPRLAARLIADYHDLCEDGDETYGSFEDWFDSDFLFFRGADGEIIMTNHDEQLAWVWQPNAREWQDLDWDEFIGLQAAQRAV